MLLRRLRSDEAGIAWTDFIDRYAPLIMTVVNRFDSGNGRKSDCFLYVCERLCDDGFRRLLRFRASTAVRFESWLGVVVLNLCVDWHRKLFGRATLLPAVSALPSFDRDVYRLVIEKGMGKEAVYQALLADHPDLTREIVVNSVLRIYRVLTPRQRWQIQVWQHRRVAAGEEETGSLDRLPSLLSGPEDDARERQELELLQAAMDELTPQDRLLLRLRYQEGLSLKKIAELLQLGDVNRAFRKIQAAVKALRGVVEENNFIVRRKK